MWSDFCWPLMYINIMAAPVCEAANSSFNAISQNIWVYVHARHSIQCFHNWLSFSSCRTSTSFRHNLHLCVGCVCTNQLNTHSSACDQHVLCIGLVYNRRVYTISLTDNVTDRFASAHILYTHDHTVKHYIQLSTLVALLYCRKVSPTHTDLVVCESQLSRVGMSEWCVHVILLLQTSQIHRNRSYTYMWICKLFVQCYQTEQVTTACECVLTSCGNCTLHVSSYHMLA